MKQITQLVFARTIASITFELILGLLGGFIFGLIGAIICGVIFKIREPSFGDLIGALIGFSLFYTVAMPVCVYLVGTKLFAHNSSFWMTLLASVCGVMAILGLAEPLRINLHPQLLAFLMLLVPLILSVFSYNYSIKSTH